jgi:nucleoside-diphosphate-sugar epimerase
VTQLLIIGGTRFIGRHTVEAALAAGYDVTLFNRGQHDNPFAGREEVGHVEGDRTSDAALRQARDDVEPEIVVDICAYHPGEVRSATEVFADVGTYVYISSAAAYGEKTIPKREGETRLRSCTDEQAREDTRASYGPRKAEGDRAVFEAAKEGINAVSLRPTSVYGPHDWVGRVDYWADRIEDHDRVLVPGDGTSVFHLVAVENVARATLRVAEDGVAGTAYNVGDRQILTLDQMLECIADALSADVEFVHASERELAAGELEPTDFPLYPNYPHVLSTDALDDLGWTPVEPEPALSQAVTAAYEPDMEPGPARTDEENILAQLEDTSYGRA